MKIINTITRPPDFGLYYPGLGEGIL